MTTALQSRGKTDSVIVYLTTNNLVVIQNELVTMRLRCHCPHHDIPALSKSKWVRPSRAAKTPLVLGIEHF